MPDTVPKKQGNLVKAQTWEMGDILDSYCSHIGRAESLCIVTSNFIHRQIHRKTKYICATYPPLCALIEPALLRPIRKGQLEVLLATLSV